MENTNQDMIEYMRQHNKRVMRNLLGNFYRRRNRSKVKENLKKMQAESLKQLKEKFPLTTDLPNSSLDNLISKLFE